MNQISNLVGRNAVLTALVVVLCASCDKEAPSPRVVATNYAGPPSGGVVVLVPLDDSQPARRRRIEGRGLNQSKQLVVFDSIVDDKGTIAERKELSYSVRDDGLVMHGEDLSDSLVLANADSVPSTEWPVASMRSDSSENGQAVLVSGKCRIEARAKRKLSEQDRQVLTTRCTAVLPQGGQLVQFRDFAEGLGIVGATDETQAEVGKHGITTGWRFEKLEFAEGP